MVHQDARERDLPPAKANDPDYLRKKRVKEAKTLARLAANKSSEILQQQEEDDDQTAVYMMLSLDASPIVKYVSPQDASDPAKIRQLEANVIHERDEEREKFINLQMSVLHKAMRAFHVKLTGCVVAALKIGETCGALGESFRHSDAMDMFAADVFMSAKLVPNLLRPNLSLFPWIKILTQYICSHPKRGSLDRISVRDTCRTLRDAYHESERIRRKMEDVVFDARVPDRVKVLDFFARRDETGKLNALPILRLATQHDLDATVPSDSFDVHVGWFLRDEAPRMSVYAFEAPLPPQESSKNAKSIQGQCILAATEQQRDSMFSGRDGRENNGGQVKLETWTAPAGPFSLSFLPALSLAQIRDIVVGRFRSSILGEQSAGRDGTYSIHWSSNPHHVGIILNQHSFGWLPMLAMRPVAYEAMLGGVVGKGATEKSPNLLGNLRRYTCDFHLCSLSAGRTSAKLLTCGRCKQARYCSKECQKCDWKRHKLHCCDAGAGAKSQDAVTQVMTALAKAKFTEGVNDE